MPDKLTKRAFISYVREDNPEIDRLCGLLDAANIPYWRDRKDLGPGDMWKNEIRDAIKSGSLVFVACFSSNSVAKGKSYQNEEITLAVEEYRLMPPGKTWIIPIRLDDCTIPEWDLGAGQLLGDINYVDLFGDGYTEGAIKLIDRIKALLGLSGADPATVRTAVDEADTDDRARRLRQLTKDMIRDPAREIELDELVGQEVTRILDGMRDPDRFSTSLTRNATQEELKVHLAELATEYWRLVEPFCWSLQVAARWGNPESLSPWIRGIKSLTTEAVKPVGGNTVMVDLREVPALLTTMVAALASTGGGRWDNFRALLVDNVVPHPNMQGKRLAIIESVCPWGPFGYGEVTAHILARAAQSGDDFQTAVADYDKKYGRFHTAPAEWMFRILRPLFSDQFPDDAEYLEAFDHAEVSLGVVNEDLGAMRDDGSGRPLRFRNRWFGRSLWRYAHNYCDPVEDLSVALETQGNSWKPLTSGLFAGSAARARAAIDLYRESFKENAQGMW